MRTPVWIGRCGLVVGFMLVLVGTLRAGQVETEKKGIGSFISVSASDVFIIRAGARPPGEKASLNSPQLYEGDKIVTREFGKADILLDDGSLLRLRENTDLVLKDKKPGKSKSRLQVLLGRIWAKVSKQENLLEIETPSAVAAIKGTALELIVQQNGDTVLIVWEGLVKLFNDLGETMVKAAQQSQANNGKAPGAAVDVDLSKLDQWFMSSLGAPTNQTLKTTIKDKDGHEIQLNLKYDKK
jgi:hypothetical protein